MYKVFIENTPLHIIEKKDLIPNDVLVIFEEDLSLIKDKMFQLLESIDNELPIYLVTSSIEKTFSTLFQDFDFVEAAGGIVKRKDTYLFIKRNGFWDIPKGKLDEGEIPEFNSMDIKACNLLANPGCYPQTAILGLAPLLVEKIIYPEQIIVDSKSGVSGAGRNPKQNTHFPECNESVSAYQVGKHRHTPEMEQALEKVSGEKVKIMFTPHLIPMDRGIFSTIYAKPKKEISEQAINELVGKFYKDKPFIRLVDHLPSTKDSVGTNYVDLHYKVAGDYIVVLAAEDNLIRGASGVAIQNFNLMFGFPEVTALLP